MIPEARFFYSKGEKVAKNGSAEGMLCAANIPN